MINDDLTIGRTDRCLLPFNGLEIVHFIHANKNRIDDLIMKLIVIYYKDSNIKLLKNPENDWIREFMPEFLDTTNVEKWL